MRKENKLTVLILIIKVYKRECDSHREMLTGKLDPAPPQPGHPDWSLQLRTGAAQPLLLVQKQDHTTTPSATLTGLEEIPPPQKGLLPALSNDIRWYRIISRSGHGSSWPLQKLILAWLEPGHNHIFKKIKKTFPPFFPYTVTLMDGGLMNGWFWMECPNLYVGFLLFHIPSFPFSVDCVDTSQWQLLILTFITEVFYMRKYKIWWHKPKAWL